MQPILRSPADRQIDPAAPNRPNPMTRKFSRFWALSRPERRVLLVSILLLPLFWIGLRVRGLARFQAWLNRSPVFARASASADELAGIAALVEVAGNHAPGPSSCLTRSLLLGWLLRRRGVRSELRIGVRLVQGDFEAHAWVEHEGKPINAPQGIAIQFVPFDDCKFSKSYSPR